MRIISLISFMVLSTASLWAQEPTIDSIGTDSSTTGAISESQFGIKNPLSFGKGRVKTRFLLFEMGINTYHHGGQLNIPASLETYELRHGRSLEINLHFYRQRIRIGKGFFNIEHGLSLDFNHYAFQNDVNYRTDPDKALFIDNSVDLDRSRLRLTNLILPIMLRLESNPSRLWRSFHLGVGVYGSLRLGSDLRTKKAGESKHLTMGNFGLNDFTAGFRGEIGYGPINLYVKYSFMGLFKEGRGPDLTPFSMGFILLPF